MKSFTLALLALSLTGCAHFGTSTPSAQQRVYAVENDFSAALTVAVAYENLPPCGLTVTPSPAVCADKHMVSSITLAAKTARAALATAEAAVRSNSTGAAAAVEDARAAVSLLQQVLTAAGAH